MTALSIGLTVLGLIFEFLSFYRAIRVNLFLDYSKYINGLGKRTVDVITSRKSEARSTLYLMAFGMILQGVALVVN